MHTLTTVSCFANTNPGSHCTHAMKKIPPQLDVPERSVGLTLAFSPAVPSNRPRILQITTSKIRQLRVNPIARLHTHTHSLFFTLKLL